MNDEGFLRERARELVRAGKLPGRRPQRVWGGSGASGGRCELCGSPVRPEDIVLEVAVEDGAGTRYPRLHARCFSIFERALEPEGAPIPDGMPSQDAG